MNISIIIPYKNTLEKLERLLMSIPPKCEVIIVDDNSDSDKKAKTLKNMFSSFLFLENKGEIHNAGAARNIGIQYATNDWLLFADADDYFLKNAFDLIEKELDSFEDIIFFTPTSIYEESGELASRHIPYKNLINNLPHSELLRYKFYIPWSKLIKRSLIVKNNIKFDEVIASNDINFSLKTGIAAKTIKSSTNIIYCATRSKNTLTTTRNKNFFISRLDAKKRYNLILRENNLYKLEQGFLIELLSSLSYGMSIFLYTFSTVYTNKFCLFNKSAFNNLFSFIKYKNIFIKIINKINEKRYLENG